MRKARLVALLIDAYADRLFAVDAGADDILEYRAALAAVSPALALVFALAANRPAGPQLVTEAVAVPLADYPTLDVADFMVSIYNDRTIQRVLVAMPDGQRLIAHAVLEEAIEILKGATN